MIQRSTYPQKWPLIAFLLCLYVIVCMGCSYQSVRHLNRQPWELNKYKSLTMNYLTFEYICTQTSKGLKVQGQAYPKNNALPSWAKWVHELWLGAYLSDQKGQVLAKKINVLPPQTFGRKQGYPFTFILRPQDMGTSGPIYITFGYRLVLTRNNSITSKDIASEKKESKQKEVFFASESALTRF